MKYKMRVILALLIIISGVMMYRYHQQERRILRSFRRLCSHVELKERENPARAALRIQRILPYFTPDAILSSETLARRGVGISELQQLVSHRPGHAKISGRDEIRALLLATRTNLDKLSVRIMDHTISVNPENDTAEMKVTLRVSAQSGRHGDTVIEDQRISWVKVDGRWLINASETSHSIQRPATSNY